MDGEPATDIWDNGPEDRTDFAGALEIGPTPADAIKLLPLIDISAWAEREPLEREWTLEGFIPRRQMTYCTGPGAGGKSLLWQHGCTCSALALPFMGMPIAAGITFYVTCEDDEHELERRQKAICEAIGADRSALVGRLHVATLQGHLGNELVRFDGSGRMATTEAYHALERTALSVGAQFVVLDNVAHLFSGNENSRNEVAAFVNLLNRLAITIDGSVLLIGHPNKAGAEWSGSTAWENQVRSRLYLEIEDPDIDPDARTLTASKANYARNGGTLKFRWHKGAFVRDSDLPDDYIERIQATTEASAENEAFMRCLAAATKVRRAVSHHVGANYAPTIFCRMPEGRPFTRDAFERAFERLLHVGRIKLDQQLWQGENRHRKVGIAAAESCANPPAPTPCAELRQPLGQVIENTAPTLRAPTPLYTTYIGRGLEGPAPSEEQNG